MSINDASSYRNKRKISPIPSKDMRIDHEIKNWDMVEPSRIFSR